MKEANIYTQGVKEGEGAARSTRHKLDIWICCTIPGASLVMWCSGASDSVSNTGAWRHLSSCAPGAPGAWRHAAPSLCSQPGLVCHDREVCHVTRDREVWPPACVGPFLCERARRNWKISDRDSEDNELYVWWFVTFCLCFICDSHSQTQRFIQYSNKYPWFKVSHCVTLVVWIFHKSF